MNLFPRDSDWIVCDGPKSPTAFKNYTGKSLWEEELMVGCGLTTSNSKYRYFIKIVVLKALNCCGSTEIKF